ncbi:restriction endonuclease subunit S [Enterobacter ludwigii]
MAKYKAYPEYKDSGVEWLGRIPRHWVCSVLKRLCSLTTGLTPPTTNEDNYAEEGYPWVRPEDINENGLETQASKFVSYTGWKLLRHIEPNSTLICCIGTIGKCGYVRETISTNQQITAATFHNSERFYFYLMQAARTQLEELATGNVLKILNSERLGSLNMVKVEEKEATSIAVFLDHETAKIDNLIEKQQQLIELLKEKRQAVISHAVTKGLNPNVPMKDSGVEWLGKVPEHWTVSTIKHISTFIGTGGTPKNSESFTDDDGIDWFSPGDFNGSLVLRHAKKKITTQAVSNGDAKCYPKDSIVVIGIGATLGKVAFVDHEFSCNQQINIITPSKTVDHKYLTYSLLNQVEQMKQSSNASTIGIMNQEKTKQIWIAFPPKDEQIKILSVLSQKEIEFDELLKKSEYQILLLQERRTALISAAVTGKIDVRDWVDPDSQDIEASQEAIA